MRIPVHLSTLGSKDVPVSTPRKCRITKKRASACGAKKKGPAELAGGNPEIMLGNGWKMAVKWW